MTPDDARLHELARAIVAGAATDWASAESSVADESMRRVIGELKVIADVAKVHRAPHLATAPHASAYRSEPPRGTSTSWSTLLLLEKVGEGAHGQVYRAWDTRLDREVALKLLPESLAGGDERTTSIIEEGRVLARVRHPNVVTIYGAERIENRVGLWMEFIRGRTLEQVLEDGGPFTAADVIRVGIELCRAVSAVHAAGFLHRDIKAHNVMVADNGRVVLMDFGTGRELGNGSSTSLAGTPLYLAPEVLRGAPATVESDIYSVGVLLYHLLTSSYPVRAHHLRDLQAAHERHDRTDVRTARPDVPPKLSRVIDRCTDPRSERRYKTAQALEIALVKSRPRSARLICALAAVAALTLGAGVFVSTNRSRAIVVPPTSFWRPNVSVVPVTSLAGEKMYPAVSPDGSRVAFMWDRGGGFDVYVKHVNSDATVQLTQSPGGGGSFPTWSPDSQYIAFLRRMPADPGKQRDAIIIVPAVGGSEHTLLSEPDLAIGSGLDWSPDGKDLVLAARNALNQPWRLMLVSITSGERRWLTGPPRSSSGDTFPVFSPDGSSIAYIHDTGSANSLYAISSTGGEPRRLMTASSRIRRAAWTADGQTLIFTAYRGGGRNSLSRIAVGSDTPEAVAGTGEGASDPSIARLQGRLVFTQSVLDRNLYRAELAEGDGASITKLVATTREDSQPDISPDGTRIAFVSDRTGHSEIWVMDTSGTNAVPVTGLKTTVRHPRWSPDGRYIAFNAHVSGVSRGDIHVVDAASRMTQRLTFEGSSEEWPTWSADSAWIYFMSDRTGTREIWKVSAHHGRAEQVTAAGGLKAWETRDGSFIYYSNGAPAIWRLAPIGGEPEFVFGLPAGTAWGGEWVLSDRGIYWVNGKASPHPVIEFFNFATRRVTRAVTPSGRFDVGGGFSVSSDGRWLAFAQRDYDGSDIMMMDGFQ